MVIIAYLGNQGGKTKKKNLKIHLKLQQLEIWHYYWTAVLSWYKDRSNYKASAFTVKKGVNITKSQYLKWNDFCSCITINSKILPDMTQ